MKSNCTDMIDRLVTADDAVASDCEKHGGEAVTMPVRRPRLPIAVQPH